LGLLLALANQINRRTGRRCPDGWLVTIAASGVFTHAILTGAYLFTLDAAYRSLFAADLIFLAQPFVAGTIAGAVFWVARSFHSHYGNECP
jgi:hypothetical protein